jgi:hypothetical protein
VTGRQEPCPDRVQPFERLPFGPADRFAFSVEVIG